MDWRRRDADARRECHPRGTRDVGSRSRQWKRWQRHAGSDGFLSVRARQLLPAATPVAPRVQLAAWQHLGEVTPPADISSLIARLSQTRRDDPINIGHHPSSLGEHPHVFTSSPPVRVCSTRRVRCMQHFRLSAFSTRFGTDSALREAGLAAAGSHRHVEVAE